jgi:CheY-like chemotaxis protein
MPCPRLPSHTSRSTRGGTSAMGLLPPAASSACARPSSRPMLPARTARHCRTSPNGRTPVLMLTAKGRTSTKAGFGDGADDYVVKPVEPRVLRPHRGDPAPRPASVRTEPRRTAAGRPDRLRPPQRHHRRKLRRTHDRRFPISFGCSPPSRARSSPDEILRSCAASITWPDRSIDARICRLCRSSTKRRGRIHDQDRPAARLSVCRGRLNRGPLQPG